MRLVCISDTHTYHKGLTLPEGDVLLHSGDYTNVGHLKDVRNFAYWAGELDYEHKVLIAGNHDFCHADHQKGVAKRILNASNITYLEDDSCDITHGDITIKVHGTPWQPWFHDWAFNLETEEEMQEKWDMIPDGTDVLLVHGPPANCLDTTADGRHTGSHTLRKTILEKQIGLVVCGHIHEDRGLRLLEASRAADYRPTWVANASVLTRRYHLQNQHAYVFDVTMENGRPQFTPVDDL